MSTLLNRRRAMMMSGGKGETILYELYNTTFDGTNGIDTGVNLFEYSSFVVEMSFSVIGTAAWNNTYLSNRSTTTTNRGFDIRWQSQIDFVGDNIDSRVPIADVYDVLLTWDGEYMNININGTTASRKLAMPVETNLMVGRANVMGRGSKMELYKLKCYIA